MLRARLFILISLFLVIQAMAAAKSHVHTLVQSELCLIQQTPATKLQAGDVLEVEVLGSTELSSKVQILNDGTITGPGYEQIKAAGRTIAQLKVAVIQALRKRLKSPNVSIVVIKTEGQFFFISGTGLAKTPGAVPFIPDQKVKEVISTISVIGYPDEYNISVQHKDGSTQIDSLSNVLMADNKIANQVVQPDDLFQIIPKKQIRVWVNGLIARPGEYRFEQGDDVYKAISTAGGIGALQLSGNGSQSGLVMSDLIVEVQRGPETLKTSARMDAANPPILLEPNDVVTVVEPKQIRVTISGEINYPGEFIVREGSSLQYLLNVAHGATINGTYRGVVVFRGENVYSVDAEYIKSIKNDSLPVSPAKEETSDSNNDSTGVKLLENSGVAKPFQLEEGDRIYVQPNERDVFVFGTVGRPGKYVIPDGRTLHATDALALAGGITNGGVLRRVTLIHAGSDGKFVRTLFNLDEFLKDGKPSANPLLSSGDILLFGKAQDTTLNSLSSIVNSVYLFRVLTGH